MMGKWRERLVPTAKNLFLIVIRIIRGGKETDERNELYCPTCSWSAQHVRCPKCGAVIQKNFFQVKGTPFTPGVRACFVVTACFDDENHPTVQAYREFRDNFLITNRFGEKVISFYYNVGSHVANAIKNNKPCKKVIRSILQCVSRYLPMRK